MVSLPPINHLQSCSKRFNIDHFSTSHGSSFTRCFVYLSERNGALISLRHVTLCFQVQHRTPYMIFLSPIQILSQLVHKRSNIDHFSRSCALSLTQRFVYFSGRNCILYMFAVCHDVSLSLLQKIVNDLVSNIDFIATRNSCTNSPILTIFRGLADRHLRGVLSISRVKIGASNMCLQHHDVLPRFPKVSAYPFSCLQFLKIFVLEKFQLCTIFRRFTDHCFGAVSTIFFVPKWRSRYVCATPRCVIKIVQRYG